MTVVDLLYYNQIGLGAESVPGTAVTRTLFPALTEDMPDMNWEQEDRDSGGMDASVVQSVAIRGNGQAGGGFTAFAMPTTLAAQLAMLIGRTDGEQGYLSVEHYNAIQGLLYSGCRVSELTLDLGEEGVTYQPTIIGMNKPTAVSKTAGTIVAGQPFHGNEATHSFDGSNDAYEVTELSMAMDFAMEPKFTGKAKTVVDYGPTVIRQGRPVITLDMEMFFDAADMQTKFLAGTEFAYMLSLERTISNVVYKVTFDLPRLRIQSAEVGDDADRTNVSLTCKAFMGDDDYGLEIIGYVDAAVTTILTI